MNCNCIVCNGRDYNPIGIEVAEKEVIPFFKKDLLNLKYPSHPFPREYEGLLASIYAYSQALVYNRAHKVEAIYYTENKYMLRYSKELNAKFGMIVLHSSELRSIAQEVCEYNTGN